MLMQYTSSGCPVDTCIIWTLDIEEMEAAVKWGPHQLTLPPAAVFVYTHNEAK